MQEASCAEQVVVLRARIVGIPEGSPWEQQRTVHVVIGLRSVGIVTGDERRAAWGAKLPPGAERQRAREEALENAHLLAVTSAGAFLDQKGQLRVVRGQGQRVIVTDASTLPEEARPLAALDAAGRDVLLARGRALLAETAGDAIAGQRAEALRLLDRALAKLERRIAAIGGDLAKIGQADAIAAQAQWLVAEATKAPRGASKLVVTDWSTGEPVPLEITLDPGKSAKDQVLAMFKRAKRLRLGAAIANDRLTQTTRQRDAVLEARLEIEAATTLGAVAQHLEDAKRSAPRDVTLPRPPGSSRKNEKKTRVPYRTFLARSGRRLLVGKGGADNDALTLHVARPYDLWLHAKDRTGAHVIVVRDRGQDVASEDLVDGAHLAAHFSDARGETIVDVQYTDRRYLRKPKGSPAGFVVVDREKVLVLRSEAGVLAGLLEREDIVS